MKNPVTAGDEIAGVLHNSSVHFSADYLRDRIGTQGITFTFSRSGGPGGQNVNKVSTRATLRFALESATALSDSEKERVRRQLAKRMTEDGFLQIIASRHRTQAANKAAALERLYELLADALQVRKVRRPTKAPKSAKVRRLREKQTRGETKRLRGRPSAE